MYNSITLREKKIIEVKRLQSVFFIIGTLMAYREIREMKIILVEKSILNLIKNLNNT